MDFDDFQSRTGLSQQTMRCFHMGFGHRWWGNQFFHVWWKVHHATKTLLGINIVNLATG